MGHPSFLALLWNLFGTWNLKEFGVIQSFGESGSLDSVAVNIVMNFI
jgi:hypothetical protein